MGKNKHVSHSHTTIKNSNGNSVKVAHSNHYNDHSYEVIAVNGSEVNTGKAYESLSNAVKSTEK